MENCLFLDKYGNYKINKLQELDKFYTELECVLDDKMNLSDMYYPLIIASSKYKYLKKIKLALRAMKENVKYIQMEKERADEYHIIYYKKPENKEKAIIYSYLIKKYHKKISKNYFNPIEFLLNHLIDDNEERNRRLYLSRYINYEIEKKNDENIKKIIKNNKLTIKEKYIAKYNYIEKYDNFKSFYEKYELIKKDALNLLKSIMISKDFKNYSKNIKIYPFIFSLKYSIAGNPLFISIEDSVKKYASNYKIKI
jgi:hypothetical protein